MSLKPNYGTYFVTTAWDRSLPLHLTGMGHDNEQHPIHREHGFPSFHWLHTIKGCGDFTVGGSTYRLQANQGILVKPNVPHHYQAVTDKWEIWYMTFDGALANPITASLELPQAQPIGWEPDSPMAHIHETAEEKCKYSFDLAGVNGSLEVYAFLTLLKQYGQLSGQSSLSAGHERLTPIYLLIEEEYGNSALGLEQMAATLAISPQHLNTLFRKSWGLSPYQYLLQFRIQKSKELLRANRRLTVREVALAVGFQDDSHFVHTFRRLSGMTPVQFRLQFSD